MKAQVYDQVSNEEGFEVKEEDKELGTNPYYPPQPIMIQQLSIPPSARSITPLKKAIIAIAFVVGCAGLIAGMVSFKANMEKGDENGSGVETTTGSISSLARLSHFDESILGGYAGNDGCDDLQDDLLEAVELMTNITIDSFATSHFNNPWLPICRGGGNGCWAVDNAIPSVEFVDSGDILFDVPEQTAASENNAKVPAADDVTDAGGGEDSFGTNNQVDGVDEADFVKSDGTNVFAAYHDTLVVWSAQGGDILSETSIPTDDQDGIDICDEDAARNATCYKQEYGYSWKRQRKERKLSMMMPMPLDPIKISSLLLHGDKLVVIASTSYDLQNSEAKLDNGGHTRVFIYDVSAKGLPSDGSALTLIARKDLQGKYQTARSIENYAHIVSASSLDTRSHLDHYIYPWDRAYTGMNETEYRSAALEIARDKAKLFASDLTSELIALFNNDCSKLAKVAIMLREQDGADGGETVLPSFTDSSVLKSLTQVHSFDIDAGSSPIIAVKSSGIFFPTASYTTNVYASAEKLVVAGEAYIQDSLGDWNERTVLLVYGLNGDSSIPEAVGEVPGSLLNQFSMDHYYDANTAEDYLRVATTSWGKWGYVDGSWKQIETSESQISVLKIPSASSESDTLEIVGSATGIGIDERIYAARFFGEKAYVVTFRQIDPFYTVNMTDPTNPRVVGELKIPGFSNYLHPIDGSLILAIGQNATKSGRTDGLMISLFDVSNFANPTRVREYVEDSSASSSDAQYDHRAFRYLPESKLLILPLNINSWATKESFDGFVVYDVDESEPFSKKFNISHFDGAKGCWSRKHLSSRSMTFNGDVMTLKGHKVLSHSLEDESYKWELNLDANQSKEPSCYPWF